jgi:membrane-associated phospholipid phosphatase
MVQAIEDLYFQKHGQIAPSIMEEAMQKARWLPVMTVTMVHLVGIKMYKLRHICYAALILQSSLIAKSNTERAGDILTLLIPAVAYGSTLYNKDTSGQIEFYKAYGSTIALTQLLKETVREPRPNNPNSHTSFPSGHSSSAFSGAAFIHKKYGLKYALPAYLAATYTAYSRVYAKKHYTKDVVAGALLGIGLTWYFTTPYQKITVLPQVDASHYGVQCHYQW